MPNESMQPFAASPEAMIGYAMITAIYFFLVVVVTLSSRLHDLRLIGIGLLTAVASIGYTAIVSGGAIVTGPMLMKIAVLLILGGLATRLLSAAAPQSTVGSGESSHV